MSTAIARPATAFDRNIIGRLLDIGPDSRPTLCLLKDQHGAATMLVSFVAVASTLSQRVFAMNSEPGTKQSSVQSVRNDLKRRTFPAGATIFAEGEAGAVAYILLRGDATIFIGFGTPHQRMVTTLKPGQMFGVHALMAGANRTATVVTTQGCDVLAVSEAKLKQKLGEADPFLRYWVDYLSQRVIDLSVQQ
jgi:CRP-like cAMP-binding protein